MSMKIGARNSATDMERIQSIHDTVCGLGAECSGAKAISMEENLSAIHSAIYKAMRADAILNNPGNIDPDYGYILAVYDTFAIVESGGSFTRIPFTSNDGTITVADRDQWQDVEKEWVVKTYRATDVDVPASQLATNIGNAIKSVGDDGHVAGYLVVYGDKDNHDLTPLKDFFTPETDFMIEDGQKTHVFYQHGLDDTIKRRRIGTGTLKRDPKGIWIDAQLDLADEYAKMVYDLVTSAKSALGWSSGTAAHLVERKNVGGAHEIKSWPLGIDASITPTPAEYRTRPDLSVKHTVLAESTDAQAPAQDVGDTSLGANASEDTAPHVDNNEVKTMSDNVNTHEALNSDELAKRLSDLEAKMAELPANTKSFSVTSQEDTKMEQMDAFKSYLRGVMTMGEYKVAGQLTEGVPADGGVLAPDVWADTVIQARNVRSILRGLDGVVFYPGVNGKSLTVPAAGGAGTALTRIAEEAAIPTDKPTFTGYKMEPHKYPLIYIASDELVSDSAYDLGAILRNYFANKVAKKENQLFATGTGTNEPQGIFVGAPTGATAGSATVITYADLVALYGSVDESYKSDAVWFVSPAAFGALSSLVTNTNGPLAMSIGPDGNFTLLGKRVIQMSAGPALTTGQKPIVFGSPSGYAIVDWAGIEVKFLNERYADTGQVGWRFQTRLDAGVVDGDALKALAMA